MYLSLWLTLRVGFFRNSKWDLLQSSGATESNFIGCQGLEMSVSQWWETGRTADTGTCAQESLLGNPSGPLQAANSDPLNSPSGDEGTASRIPPTTLLSAGMFSHSHWFISQPSVSSSVPQIQSCFLPKPTRSLLTSLSLFRARPSSFMVFQFISVSSVVAAVFFPGGHASCTFCTRPTACPDTFPALRWNLLFAIHSGHLLFQTVRTKE